MHLRGLSLLNDPYINFKDVVWIWRFDSIWRLRYVTDITHEKKNHLDLSCLPVWTIFESTLMTLPDFLLLPTSSSVLSSLSLSDFSLPLSVCSPSHFIVISLLSLFLCLSLSAEQRGSRADPALPDWRGNHDHSSSHRLSLPPSCRLPSFSFFPQSSSCLSLSPPAPPRVRQTSSFRHVLVKSAASACRCLTEATSPASWASPLLSHQ